MDLFAERLNGLMVEIFRYILKFEEKSIRKIQRHNLSMSEYHLIECIGSSDRGKKISDIAQESAVTLSSVTVAINKLLAKGYVKKEKCSEDGRVTYVSLTRSGKCADEGHRKFHEQMVRNMTSEFSPNEKDILLSCMLKLKEYFKANV